MALGGVLKPNADIDDLRTALATCSQTPVSCLSREEISDRLDGLYRATTVLDALRAEAVRAGKAVGVGELNDQRNVANHMAERSNLDPADVRADQRRADWLIDFPTFADAYASGRLTTAHLEELRLKDNPRVHQQMIADQSKFVRWMTSVAFRDLDQMFERWLLGADPDGAEPKDQIQDCGLSVKVLPGGKVKVSGVLDPLTGSLVRNGINREAKKVRAEHKAADIRSTNGYRNAVALGRLITAGIENPVRKATRPLLNITIDQKTYEETLDWLDDPANNPLPTPDVEPSGNLSGRKCELIDGTPIHPIYAIAASAKAVFRRIIYDAKGRALQTSYDSRSFPGWITDLALIATNGKSANPVCDAPMHWLQTDHIEPDSLGGETTLANARPLSEADNGWRGNDTSRGRWPMPELVSTMVVPVNEVLPPELLDDYRDLSLGPAARATRR